jgi:hypothetical protein
MSQRRYRYTVGAADLPLGTARRNSRVPKLLPHRLFPRVNFSVWVDGKLQLFIDPLLALRRFLVEPRAVFAAPRNLRRDTIDDEHEWIDKKLCGRKPPACAAAATAQWRSYQAAQAARPGWERHTHCIEGALLLVDLRSAAAQCLLCAWFNEWAAGSERDQLAFSYVHYALGLATASATSAAATSPAGGPQEHSMA